jgi:hypothetical protein
MAVVALLDKHGGHLLRRCGACQAWSIRLGIPWWSAMARLAMLCGVVAALVVTLLLLSCGCFFFFFFWLYIFVVSHFFSVNISDKFLAVVFREKVVVMKTF